MKKSTGVKYNPGDLGGRGCHPSDPTGEFYGLRHQPLPLPHEKGTDMKTTAPVPVKYMLLDVTTVETACLLLVGTMRQIQLHGQLAIANGRKVIAPPLEGRGFAKLDQLALQYLYWNSCQLIPPQDFGELCQACLFAFQKVAVDATPIEWLEAEVAKLAPPPTDGDEQVEKPAPKEKKQHQPGTAYEQPKATTTTGLVWVLAAEVLTKFPPLTEATDWKPIRVAILAACENEGINAATAATQYSKFKASKIAALQS